jgi:hypothetical protein
MLQANCGTCKTVCPFNSECTTGSCGCLTNFADCNNDLGLGALGGSNGCEIDLQSDQVMGSSVFLWCIKYLLVMTTRYEKRDGRRPCARLHSDGKLYRLLT